jgi:HlyD family secretion protein
MAATFTVDAFPGQSFRGEIVQIRKAPLVVQNVVTYTTVIAVANPDRTLMPGMTANVRMQTGRRDDVVRVPNAALRFRPPAEAGAAADAGAARPRTGERSGTPAAPPSAPRGAAGPARDGESQRRPGVDGSPAGTPARVFALGPDGAPRAIPIAVGASDGAYSEVLAGDLRPGQEVIVGQTGAATPASGRQGGPRLRF